MSLDMRLREGFDYAEAADTVEELTQKYEALVMQWQAKEIAKEEIAQ